MKPLPGGDPFKKVQRGDSLRVPAAAYNAFIDVVRRGQQGQELSRTPKSDLRGQPFVRIRNDSDADRAQGEILGITGPLIDPAVNEDAFAAEPMLSCNWVSAAEHFDAYAVLLEPIASGSMGRACADGVCVAKVNVLDSTHRYAIVNDSVDPTHLVSAEAGPARIFWKEADSGVQWSIIAIGHGTPATPGYGYGGYYGGGSFPLTWFEYDETKDCFEAYEGITGLNDANTDADHKLYFQFANSVQPIYIFKNGLMGMDDLVAHADMDGLDDAQTLTLVEENGSGLGGTFQKTGMVAADAYYWSVEFFIP